MLWDLFCRVIDNHGDIGVCWRLAADLAARGEAVRLWCDDVSALAWMAPQGAAGVEVIAWSDDNALREPGDVVVEAFGCDPPDDFVRRMAARHRPPVWINLEYLSAEAYVERCHGLASPQFAGPGAGLVKRFFYPGFTARTGGLIRERGLSERRAGFDAAAWLGERGLVAKPGERIVSLFCYDNAALPALLDSLSREPTLLLATAGHAARQARQCLGPGLRRAALRCVAVPLMTQPDYDHLLWASDLNFVRAMWAGRPFVWQIYPQADGAHAAKLEAFLAQFLVGCEPVVANALEGLWRSWNGLADGFAQLPPLVDWQQACLGWRDRLLALPDLGTQLIGWAAETG